MEKIPDVAQISSNFATSGVDMWKTLRFFRRWLNLVVFVVPCFVVVY